MFLPFMVNTCFVNLFNFTAKKYEELHAAKGGSKKEKQEKDKPQQPKKEKAQPEKKEEKKPAPPKAVG